MRLYITKDVATVGRLFKVGDIADVQNTLAEALVAQEKAVPLEKAGALLMAAKSQAMPEAIEEEPEDETVADDAEAEDSPEEEQEQEADDDQCKAITSSGDRCKNKAKDGSDYCSVHQEQAE